MVYVCVHCSHCNILQLTQLTRASQAGWTELVRFGLLIMLLKADMTQVTCSLLQKVDDSIALLVLDYNIVIVKAQHGLTGCHHRVPCSTTSWHHPDTLFHL